MADFERIERDVDRQFKEREKLLARLQLREKIIRWLKITLLICALAPIAFIVFFALMVLTA